mmetsp:Transcript_35376/g.92020  ORF Transcript_35376/g.92020 Transcript_35376/m.92020 type:complete len:317 (+) Transcript_35376:297-1247(+)
MLASNSIRVVNLGKAGIAKLRIASVSILPTSPTSKHASIHSSHPSPCPVPVTQRGNIITATITFIFNWYTSSSPSSIPSIFSCTHWLTQVAVVHLTSQIRPSPSPSSYLTSILFFHLHIVTMQSLHLLQLFTRVSYMHSPSIPTPSTNCWPSLVSLLVFAMTMAVTVAVTVAMTTASFALAVHLFERVCASIVIVVRVTILLSQFFHSPLLFVIPLFLSFCIAVVLPCQYPHHSKTNNHNTIHVQVIRWGRYKHLRVEHHKLPAQHKRKSLSSCGHCLDYIKFACVILCQLRVHNKARRRGLRQRCRIECQDFTFV